jgi:hypothetical protein
MDFRFKKHLIASALMGSLLLVPETQAGQTNGFVVVITLHSRPIVIYQSKEHRSISLLTKNESFHHT